MSSAGHTADRYVKPGSFYTMSAQGVKLIIQTGTTAILARLLDPTAFGIMALITPLLTFFIVFRDLGLANATIQKPTITAQEISNLFWLNAAAGLVFAAIIAALGPLVAGFYHDNRLTAVIAVMALTFVFNGSLAQYQAVFQRSFRIRRLVFIDVLSTLTGSVIAVFLAARGLGYWSLAVMPVAVQAASFGLSVGLSGWHPSRPRWDGTVLAMVRTGAGFAGFNLFNFLARNMDQILIGKVCGEEPLGFYSQAYRLMLVPLSQVTTPLAQIMVPVLSRLNEEPGRYARTYIRTVEKIMFFCVPVVMANITGADWTVRILLGAKWLPSAHLYLALGFAALVQPVNNSIGWLYISQGRSKDMFLWGVASSAIVVLSFAAGLPWGPIGVAWGYSTVQLLLITPLLWFHVTRRGAVRPRDFVGLTVPFLITGGVGGILFACLRTIWTPTPLVGLAADIVWLYGFEIIVFLIHPTTRPMVLSLMRLWPGKLPFLAAS